MAYMSHIYRAKSELGLWPAHAQEERRWARRAQSTEHVLQDFIQFERMPVNYLWRA
jgi:hypothetical protein